MKLVDSHVHIGKYRISSPEIYGWLQITIEDLVDYMSENLINESWLLAHPSSIPMYKLNGNMEVLTAANKYEGVKPFCVITEKTLKRLDEYVNLGCVGVGEIKEKKTINDPSMMKVFKAAEDHNLPVLLHISEWFCYNKNMEVKDVLDKISTPIIFHGYGFWNLFGAKMEDLIETYDNVYMDISANSGYKTLKKRETSSRIFLNEYSDRVLFGTDFPILTTYDGSQLGVNRHHIDLVKDLVSSSFKRENILYKNANKLVK